MKMRLLGTALLSLVAGTMLSSPVLAQEDPGHPRINQVDSRIDRQENSVQRAEQNGNLTPGQANRDEKRDQQIQSQENRQAARNGGHLTKAEQRKDNRELNKEHRKEQKQKRKDKRARKEHREERKEQKSQ